MDENDYYSLSKCQKAIETYFTISKPTQRPYGFVPEIPELGMDVVEEGQEEEGQEGEGKRKITYGRMADALILEFGRRVDVKRIVMDAKDVMERRRRRDDVGGGSGIGGGSSGSSGSALFSSSVSAASSSSSSSSSSSHVKPKRREEVTKEEMSKGAKKKK